MSFSRSHLVDRLKAATQLDHPYPFRPKSEGMSAGVLVFVSYEDVTHSRDIEILITRRTETLETHKGQYAFPGGVKDSGDSDLGVTALRETEEEVGVPRSQIELLGELPRIWTPSGFLIHPWVGLSQISKSKLKIQPNPEELDLHFWVKLSELKSPGVYSSEWRDFLGVRVPMDVFQVGSHRIWGATAAILKNFIGRLDQVGLE